MIKSSKKIAFLAISCFALMLGACMQPVNLDLFDDDPIVQDVVARNRVGLYDRTGHGNLTSQYRSIHGLSPYNYYMVEVLEDGAIRGAIRFVSAGGLLVENLNEIGRASGGVIIGLDNDLTYIVSNARALTGYLSVFDGYYPNLQHPAPNAGGALQLPGVMSRYFLNIYAALPDAADYTIIRVPVTPGGAPPHPLPAFIINEAEEIFGIQLPRHGTTADFLFFMEEPTVYPDPNGNGELDDPFERFSFWTLRTTIAVDPDAPDDHDLSITLQPITVPDDSPVVSAEIHFSADDLGTPEAVVIIGIYNHQLFDPDSIRWMTLDWMTPPHQMRELHVGPAFVLDFDTEYLLNAPGTRFINIEATTDDGASHWSAAIAVITTPAGITP